MYSNKIGEKNKSLTGKFWRLKVTDKVNVSFSQYSD